MSDYGLHIIPVVASGILPGFLPQIAFSGFLKFLLVWFSVRWSRAKRRQIVRIGIIKAPTDSLRSKAASAAEEVDTGGIGSDFLDDGLIFQDRIIPLFYISKKETFVLPHISEDPFFFGERFRIIIRDFVCFSVHGEMLAIQPGETFKFSTVTGMDLLL